MAKVEYNPVVLRAEKDLHYAWGVWVGGFMTMINAFIITPDESDRWVLSAAEGMFFLAALYGTWAYIRRRRELTREKDGDRGVTFSIGR